MARAEIRLAEIADAFDLERAIRPADREEVLAATGQEPASAALQCLSLSTEAYAGFAGRELLCLFGIRRASLLGNTGYPWLLSTEAVGRHRTAFARISRGLLGQWAKDFDLLEGYVDARHAVACRWLQWLGFILDAAEPWGAKGLPFHRYHLERLH